MRFLRWIQAAFNHYAPGGGLVLPWAGGLLLVGAAICAVASWAGIRGEVRAIATVTENVSIMSPHDGVRYSPRLRFRSAKGELVQVTANEQTDEVEFPAGDSLPVLYPAGRPEQAVIATTWRIYWVAILLGVLGVFLFDVGLVLRIVLRRRTMS